MTEKLNRQCLTIEDQQFVNFEFDYNSEAIQSGELSFWVQVTAV